jgi:hypothetical protein
MTYREAELAALFRQRAAASMATALVVENELQRRCSVEFIPPAGGHGHGVAGVSAELGEMFSSRSESITALVQQLADEFSHRHGREPGIRAPGAPRQPATGHHPHIHNLILNRVSAGPAVDCEHAL